MANPLICPHCLSLLTDDEVATLYGRMTNARRKTRSGGRNGGRKPKLALTDAVSELLRRHALEFNAKMLERYTPTPDQPKQVDAIAVDRRLVPIDDL